MVLKHYFYEVSILLILLQILYNVKSAGDMSDPMIYLCIWLLNLNQKFDMCLYYTNIPCD